MPPTAVRGICGPVFFGAFAMGPDRCYFFRSGHPTCFEPYAPAGYSDTANTLELLRCMRREDVAFKKCVGAEPRMTALPLCTTPRRHRPFGPVVAVSGAKRRAKKLVRAASPHPNATTSLVTQDISAKISPPWLMGRRAGPAAKGAVYK